MPWDLSLIFVMPVCCLDWLSKLCSTTNISPVWYGLTVTQCRTSKFCGLHSTCYSEYLTRMVCSLEVHMCITLNVPPTCVMWPVCCIMCHSVCTTRTVHRSIHAVMCWSAGPDVLTVLRTSFSLPPIPASGVCGRRLCLSTESPVSTSHSPTGAAPRPRHTYSQGTISHWVNSYHSIKNGCLYGDALVKLSTSCDSKVSSMHLFINYYFSVFKIDTHWLRKDS